jgi:hypothetical protein
LNQSEAYRRFAQRRSRNSVAVYREEVTLLLSRVGAYMTRCINRDRSAGRRQTPRTRSDLAIAAKQVDERALDPRRSFVRAQRRLLRARSTEARAKEQNLSSAVPHIGGINPLFPTAIDFAVSVLPFGSLARAKIFAPGFSSERCPGVNRTTGAPEGTNISVCLPLL